MSQVKSTPGLQPRLEAAFALNTTLRGAPFAPIAAERLPDPRDRALANRLATTALRRHGQITAVLETLLKKGVPARAGILEAVLRIGVAQLLYLDAIPAHSAIHLAVESARADKRAGRFDKLVNGALRTLQRDAETFGALPDALLLPGWLKARWQKAYGAAALEAFVHALLEGAPLDLTLKSAGPALLEALGAAPVLGTTIRVETRDAAVADLPGYAEGQWWVQDAAAAIPARLIDARPGMRVLDLCAAPGGKTAQLAAAGAAVTALDIDAARTDRLAQNLARLDLSAEIVVADALTYAPGETFDAILLDAPCSATGTFRRHPDVLLSRDQQGVNGRVALQRDLIAHALTLLAPGGTLIYCVCSLEPEEGEDQAAWALKTHSGLTLAPVAPAELDGWASPIRPDGTVRTHPGLAVPGPAGGTLDGFFIARFTAA
ncbi:RsmB/NOP family class I SAM-dependent RNA methyltransferase [Pelagibacterium xiamenense]|uniref:RsmB/NOP family class I SAM-dependent RNA methyltransferase n=1 Tax=Pelagibacterium xiamenense TaxID=2901140 RepID=UPI001E48556D|nr:RsmB/NOP family class I SAM-dependent RNA methyltransferase [Pelagibacterium xiamenense]MCD7058305.1 methyltransferase domain-containing protein [Pelagibacterium xiamenense]